MASFDELRIQNAANLLSKSVPVAELRVLLANPAAFYAKCEALRLSLVANRDTRLTGWFSGLTASAYEITSSINFEYNCIAWSADDTSSWWWPNGGYWPDGIPREVTEVAFSTLYASLGYRVCTDSDFEPGFEKIALFADRTGVPTHAARQLRKGGWTSKLGRWEDLTHDLNSLCGDRPDEYGRIVRLYKRPIPGP